MSVSEGLLVTETNNIILADDRQRRKQAAREQNRQERNRQEDPPFPMEEGVVGVAIPTVSKEDSKKFDDHFYEKSIVNLLIRFGDKPFDDQRSVAHYVLSNLEDVIVEFSHPLYKEIVELCQERLKAKFLKTFSSSTSDPKSVIWQAQHCLHLTITVNIGKRPC